MDKDKSIKCLKCGNERDRTVRLTNGWKKNPFIYAFFQGMMGDSFYRYGNKIYCGKCKSDEVWKKGDIT